MNESEQRYMNVVEQRYFLRYGRMLGFFRKRRFQRSLQSKSGWITNRKGLRDLETFYAATAKVLRQISG